MVNEIESSSVEDSPQCVLCEFVMKEIEDQLQNKATDVRTWKVLMIEKTNFFSDFQKEIEQTVRYICNKMPSSVSKQCNDFVDQYGDAVIQLLIETLKPNEICPMLKLCSNQFIQTMHGKLFYIITIQ